MTMVCPAAGCCWLVQAGAVYEAPGTRSESMLRHMLASGPRRWVLYEWLYPAIDLPWFMKNELQVRVAAACCIGVLVGCGISSIVR